ncbi:zinc ribbon domain-containing protein [Cellulomonas edaphi]|uniref:C4-type zinc ribbon domain-containing protein n=1 Tax=Cellulomonas edaphi TaxID=3053468 RepID=A0ABT7S791_9CELL|nr:C4-type zinc ribbon domain-containing protein [Cellulomons edaphi]MDM7831488.1 C4-type zinc ribbon domain-containing protein [Cellulomons edaphi]
MTTAPAADQRRLLDVQALDTRLDQLAHKRRTLPELARLAELDAQLSDLHTALVTSQTAVGDLRREVAKAEADVEQVRSRAARDQARLDSGQGSAKDLQAIQHELESLGRRQSDLEEVELEVMERLEAHESALAEVSRAHAALADRRSEVVVERDAAFAQIDAEIGTLGAERAAAAQGLDAGLVSLYERLRGQLGGSGAAALRGRRCEGCRLELNPLDLDVIKKASEDTVVRCEECGRILVRLPEA